MRPRDVGRMCMLVQFSVTKKTRRAACTLSTRLSNLIHLGSSASRKRKTVYIYIITSALRWPGGESIPPQDERLVSAAYESSVVLAQQSGFTLNNVGCSSMLNQDL